MHAARFVCIWAVLAASSLLSHAGDNASVVRIEESKIRFSTELPRRLALPAVNSAGKPLNARITLQILRADNRVLDSISTEVSIPAGSHSLEIPWSLSQSVLDEASSLYWYRLHYQVAPAASGGFSLQEGIIHLARAIPDLIHIQASAMRHPRRGSVFPVRVRVDDPRTGKGISGVVVEARFDDDDEDSKPIAAKKTDAQGFAILSMKMPGHADDSATVQITAQRGVWKISQNLDLDPRERPIITFSTDKPIYQPGQTLHMRALAFWPENQAFANEKIKFLVRDEESNVQFEEEVTTSAFGIAQADWEIPEKLRNGRYQVDAIIGDAKAMDGGEVRISRYELPEFTVKPLTDKSYYLPGQQPRLEVTAGYLFGQPVRRGTVRLIRENGTHWNSEKKKYETDEAEIQQGQLGPDGKFSAVLDMSKDFAELANSDYQRFEDVRFAAYVTDLSTNRTEQRHFTVRVSKEQIHLYVVNRPRLLNTPLDTYVTASFPDGTPASVDIVVSAIKPDEEMDFPDDLSKAERLRIAHVRTNRYGVAYVHAKPLPGNFLAHNDNSTQARLLLEASDGHGGKGIHTEHFWLDNGQYIQIKPVKSILQEGEGVAAEIESSLADQTIFVDLIGRDRLLASRRVELHHGHASVEFPYDQQFHSSVLILAHNMNAGDEEHPDSSIADGVEVLFPEPQDLDLGVHLQRTTYKPGEAAQAEFRVRSPDGRPVRSALGIVVYDQAVAERVRTDEEFGRYGFYFPYRWAPYVSIAGVSYRDLLNHKMTAPVPADFELLAAAILATNHYEREWEVVLADDRTSRADPAGIFGGIIQWTFQPLQNALQENLHKTGGYPENSKRFCEFAVAHGIDFDKLHDPWGMPYSLKFSLSGRDEVLEIMSSGPDKIAGTKDDFAALQLRWPFFASLGKIMDAAALDYTRSTGKYIRDRETLQTVLMTRGIDANALRDPWGNPFLFSFGIEGPKYLVHVACDGPPSTVPVKKTKPLQVWETTVRYFQKEAEAIDRALASHFRQTANFPADEKELQPVLEAAGLTTGALTDPWGNPYHFQFQQGSRYANQVNISIYSGDRTTKTAPVTQNLRWITVVSYGLDNKPERKFVVAEFNQVLTEQSSKDASPQQAANHQAPTTGGTGAISGTVTDPVGAVIPNAQITATNELTQAQYQTNSNSNGAYLLRNLPAGRYQILVESRGFRSSFIKLVPVTSSNLTRVDVSLEVGGASETVEVSAEAPSIETTQSSVSNTVQRGPGAKIQTEHQAFTPRLRKYFPETLVWRPELVTGPSGRAELKFQMADNITTWKMSVVASTTDGQLGLAEKELHTFLPFFVDHEPPKILTQGDQIQLPVVLRNYLSKPQEVDVTLDHAPWYSLISAARQRISVPAGEEAVARFFISADHSIHEGKERVTAANHDTGDAVERTVTVHPDGQDVTQTLATVLSGERNSFNLEIPRTAIPGSIDAELKIYPNLSAHVLDSVQGMMMRPAGCGEQITSIAFASVLTLQVLRKAGQDGPHTPGNPNAELARRARKYVNEAYQRLLNLQAANGGFPYWLGTEPDVALTAYIIDFLTQASQFIDVNTEIIDHAGTFLVAQQRTDGDWRGRYHSDKSDSNLTAHIARSLAPNHGKDVKKNTETVLAKAMAYLETHLSEWKDPYLVAQYALAASVSGHPAYVAKARSLLAELAHEEGTGTYWNLEANSTPFYGWGSAGRIETTGLVVQALARIAQQPGNTADTSLMNRGLVYLLNHKDRYGVWYSTQASVNVLKAVIEAMPAPGSSGQESVAEILVNGKPGASLHLPAANQVSGPVLANISSLLQPGENKIEVLRAKDGSTHQAQVISTHYVRWAESSATNNSNFKTGESRALRLGVKFDSTEVKTAQAVRCNVEAERIGFQGYGMMLAEIGLPPGAEVDRQSLERLRSDWTISQYDVLPDRVIVYLWPRAGGSKFSFDFKPRFAMNAAAAPSILYDYYNPEAQAIVAPARFIVH